MDGTIGTHASTTANINDTMDDEIMHLDEDDMIDDAEKQEVA